MPAKRRGQQVTGETLSGLLLKKPADSVAVLRRPLVQKDRFRQMLIDLVMQRECRPILGLSTEASRAAAAAAVDAREAAAHGKKKTSIRRCVEKPEVEDDKMNTEDGQKTSKPTCLGPEEPLTAREKDALR